MFYIKQSKHIMIISFKNKFIFIHNYKVAGSSITNALQPYGLYDPPFSRKFAKIIEKLPYYSKQMILKVLHLLNEKSCYQSHIQAKELKRMLGSDWDSMYTFGLVRNPWDWQVSLYHYMRQSSDHHQHELAKSLKDFKDYIYWRVNNEIRLQKNFFSDDKGNIIVDYIEKIENMDKFLEEISRKIGYDINVKHLNKSKHTHYTEYYDSETKRLVQNAFADDIEYFGYDFEG